MSVVEKNKIDGIALSNSSNVLMLLISDHLDWENEYLHLVQLQNKINSYIDFLETEQYRDIYPGKKFSEFCIQIHFKYQPTENCNKFIKNVNSQISSNNISIDAVIS